MTVGARHGHGTQSFTIQGREFSPLGERAYVPVVPRDFFGLSTDERYEVVGESHHAETIRRVLASQPAGAELFAMFISEPLNPFDHNAVRVDLFHDDDQGTCGHLPREQARIFTPAVRAAADRGLIPVMRAHAFGGDADRPNIGIWLGD